MEAAEIKPEKEGKYDKYEIDNCVDTLIKAEEIKADKEKMKVVGPALKKKLAGIQKASAGISSIDDIREKSKKMQAEDMEDESY